MAVRLLNIGAPAVFQSSIGDAVRPGVRVGAPLPRFQFSVGDAKMAQEDGLLPRPAERFNSPLEMPAQVTRSPLGPGRPDGFNSPLEMRGSFVASPDMIMVEEFQFSIGDAGFLGP